MRVYNLSFFLFSVCLYVEKAHEETHGGLAHRFLLLLLVCIQNDVMVFCGVGVECVLYVLYMLQTHVDDDEERKQKKRQQQ